jgi:hypothetical protein
MSAQTCRSKSRTLDLARQNIKALTDTLHVERDRYGKVYFEKASLQSSISELEALNSELYSRIFALGYAKAKKVNIAVNTDLAASGTIETFQTEEVGADTLRAVIQDSLITATLDVLTSGDTVSLLEFQYQIGIPLEVYVTDERTVIVKSSLSNVSISKLDTWISDKIAVKQRRKWFSLGLQTGLGGFAGYDCVHKRSTAGIGAYAGIGININLINW